MDSASILIGADRGHRIINRIDGSRHVGTGAHHQFNPVIQVCATTRAYVWVCLVSAPPSVPAFSPYSLSSLILSLPVVVLPGIPALPKIASTLFRC